MMGEPKKPTVKIVLEEIQSQVVMALATQAEAISREIQGAVDLAIDQFDFQREVVRLVEPVLVGIIRSEVERTLNDPKVRAAIRVALVTRSIRGPGRA